MIILIDDNDNIRDPPEDANDNTNNDNNGDNNAMIIHSVNI